MSGGRANAKDGVALPETKFIMDSKKYIARFFARKVLNGVTGSPYTDFVANRRKPTIAVAQVSTKPEWFNWETAEWLYCDARAKIPGIVKPEKFLVNYDDLYLYLKRIWKQAAETTRAGYHNRSYYLYRLFGDLFDLSGFGRNLKKLRGGIDETNEEKPFETTAQRQEWLVQCFEALESGGSLKRSCINGMNEQVMLLRQQKEEEARRAREEEERSAPAAAAGLPKTDSFRDQWDGIPDDDKRSALDALYAFGPPKNRGALPTLPRPKVASSGPTPDGPSSGPNQGEESSNEIDLFSLDGGVSVRMSDFNVKRVAGDGSCAFRALVQGEALADALQAGLAEFDFMDIETEGQMAQALRREAVQLLTGEYNFGQKDFKGTGMSIKDIVEYKEGETFEHYLAKMSRSGYAGETEFILLSEKRGWRIFIYTPGRPGYYMQIAKYGDDEPNRKEIRLLWQPSQHGEGGNHYDLLY